MEYVLTDAGNIKITDGKPTVLNDGKEVAIDAIGANDRMSQVVTQRDTLKSELRQANEQLETFSGIDDPAAAIKALQDIGSIGERNQADLDAQRTALGETFNGEKDALQDQIDNLSGSLRKATVQRDFNGSESVKGLTIPPDIAYTMFGKQFNDDGTANDTNDNPIYSIENPGSLAKGEEAITQVLKGYQNIDQITKAGNSGGGASGGSDGGGQVKTMTHEQFSAKNPAEKAAFVNAGGKVS